MIVMPEIKTDELDLHWKDAEPDLGIASEGLCCKDMNEIITRIDKVKNSVKKINLNNQHALTEIPSVLKECELLEELNISHTEITAIPQFVFTLPNLRSLSCCCRKLSAPPAGFEKAKKLERLHIRINEGWNFPEGLTSLQELKTLIIDIYSATDFPKDMGVIKKLENLTIFIKYETGTIQNLPASFAKHPALKNIDIGDHIFKNHKNVDLEKNVKLLSTCPALVSLTVSGFTVNDHKGLSHLTGLKELHLRHLITEGNILNSIAGLINLEKLNILGSEFKITELPDIFENLKELRSLSIAGNFVKNIPPSIYKLTKLTSLEIGSSGISVLGENIGNLKELEKIHVYDNILEKLPDAIYSLPRLAVLNIEENLFKQQEIDAIKQKLDTQRVEFLFEGQGQRQFVKKLRALKDSEETDLPAYFRLCLDAVNENIRALKYVNIKKLGSRYYAEVCLHAVRKTCYALKDIDPAALGQPYYYFICMEAAKRSEKTHILKSISGDLLTNSEYIQICIEAALHNTNADFLETVNHKRLDRTTYERICWVAVLRQPSTISKMINPTEELRRLAEKQGK